MCWSWALEWNHSLRITGFLDELESAQNVRNILPDLHHVEIPKGPRKFVRIREEVPLLEGELDKLFQ